MSTAEIDVILAESADAVEEAQAEYSEEASAADFAMAVRAYDELSAQLDAIIDAERIEGLQEAFALDEVSLNEAHFVTAATRCLTVYKWQLQTIAWILIGYGTFVSLAGGFASGTVIGLPLGAVMAAAGVTLGTTASFFLWKVDQQKWSSKRVCF